MLSVKILNWQDRSHVHVSSSPQLAGWCFIEEMSHCWDRQQVSRHFSDNVCKYFNIWSHCSIWMIMSLALTCFVDKYNFRQTSWSYTCNQKSQLWIHHVTLMLRLATFVAVLMFYAVDLVKTPVRHGTKASSCRQEIQVQNLSCRFFYNYKLGMTVPARADFLWV